MNGVERCLMRNGAIYAETITLEGIVVEVCKLPENEVHSCKYRRFVCVNGFEPIKLCLYGDCTYENHSDKVFVGADFVMVVGEEEKYEKK